MDTWGMLAWERRRLAEDLETIPVGKWSKPTECVDWTVREVVAHVSGIPGPLEAIVGLIRSFGDVDHYIDSVARSRAENPPAQLIEELRAFATSRMMPPGTTVSIQLCEAIVHGRDIRAAVGMDAPSDRPDEHVIKALDSAIRSGFVLRGRKRVAGLRLEATDMAWSHGEGPLVAGPAETVLWGVLGRVGAAALLDGDGVATLRSRAG